MVAGGVGVEIAPEMVIGTSPSCDAAGVLVNDVLIAVEVF